MEVFYVRYHDSIRCEWLEQGRFTTTTFEAPRHLNIRIEDLEAQMYRYFEVKFPSFEVVFISSSFNS